MNTKNVADIYKLSPIQQALLFYTLYAPESGVYFEQIHFQLQGIHQAAFKLAWQKIVDHYPILRTSFHWEDLDDPLQVVHQQVELPFAEYDWRGLAPETQKQQLHTYLQEDRQRGFTLTQAPLMRLSLLQISEEEHIAVWSYHHLLLDGWSVGIVVDQVFRIYERLLHDKTFSLPPSIPFRNYITWLGQQNLAKTEAFWRQKLLGFTKPTTLGIEAGAIKALSEHEDLAQQEIPIPQTTLSSLQTIAQQHRLTLNNLLQGAWAILLSRYSGLDDVIFGIITSGRSIKLAGMEAMVGLFINALPMRARISPNDTLLSWLEKLRDQQFEMSAYEYTPLSQIQAWSELPRGLPLFHSIILFENFPFPANRYLSGEFVVFEKTNYPLTLKMKLEPVPALQLSYDTRYFEPEMINNVLGHLRVLLESFAQNLNQPINKVPLLTTAESHQLLIAWNQTTAVYPQNQCIHQLFEAQAAQTPHKTAVSHHAHSLTYQVLNQRANQLAHHLRSLGVGPEIPVGIYLERSPEMIIALLAILKAGGFYLPLDPSYPIERLTFMLHDTQANIVLTSNSLATQLPIQGIHPILLDDPAYAHGDAENPPNITLAQNPAYIIYTSGSTGQPKGVVIQHQSLVNYVTAAIDQFGITQQDNLLQFASLSFDTAAEEIYPALLTGAQLMLRTHQMMDSVHQFFQTCAERGITVLNLPTAYWHTIVTELETHTIPFPPPLRMVIIGGEKALPERLAAWLHIAPTTVRLLNGYGPTETTIVATMVDLADKRADKQVSIGRPVANTSLYVLDRSLNLVPIGVPGELYIGGDGLARGYLNQPGLTASRFIPNPFGNIPGARLYKTADFVRYLPNGELEFLGRVDHQIKIRGFRVELGEIEAALSQHSAVQEAVVLAQDSTLDDKQLIAYIYFKSGRQVAFEELCDFLRQKLPDYMIPSRLVSLEKIPRTPSGKVDRQALPALSSLGSAAEQPFAPPRTALEEVLAGSFAELLKREQVSIHDNFFAIGGQSLIATRLVSHLRELLKVELPLRTIFESPTVAALANRLTQDPSQRERVNKTAELLLMLAGLSDDDTDSLLTQKTLVTQEE